MFKNIFLISFLVLLASCSRKVVPQIQTVIKDSVVERTVITYHSDTLSIPGDTIVYEKYIPCPDVKLSDIKHKGNTTLKVNLTNGKLEIECKADSLQHIVDSLQNITTSKERFRAQIVTVIKPVEVIKYRTPTWTWYLLTFVILYTALRVFIWRYKIPIKL